MAEAGSAVTDAALPPRRGDWVGEVWVSVLATRRNGGGGGAAADAATTLLWGWWGGVRWRPMTAVEREGLVAP